MTREERECAIDIIQSILDKYEEDECLVTEITIGDEDIEALKLAIEGLEQEPFINKPCVSEKVCEHDKQMVLDKIRAEIKGMYRVILKGTPKDDWAVSWNDCLDEVLEVIDKYKAESEE